MFIPIGTVIKSEEDVRKYCHGRDVRIRSFKVNGIKQIDVAEYYTTHSAIKSRDYTIELEPLENGYKVSKVYRWDNKNFY